MAASDIHLDTPAGSRWRRIMAVLTDQRMRPLWIVMGFGLVIFSAFRLAMYAIRYRLLADVPWRTTLHCLFLGVRYDLMVLGYALIPLVLAMSLASDTMLRRKVFRVGVTVYATLFVTLSIVFEFIGAAFFLHRYVRIRKELHYLIYPTTFKYVWNEYPLWLLILGGLAMLYIAYRVFNRAFWTGPLVAAGRYRRPVQTFVLICAVMVLCWGGFSDHPLNEGDAWIFPENAFLTHLSMNNFFRVFARPGGYPAPPADVAWPLVKAMIYQDGDEPVAGAPNPLWRCIDTGNPRKDYNVVIIVMEGMAGEPVGKLGYENSHTPELDKLCEQGMFMERMYAVGTRTNRGLTGILCGHPDLGYTSVLQETTDPKTPFLTLPTILRNRGYQTLFVYGHNPDFDSMRGFFAPRGIDRFIGRDEMNPPDQFEHWRDTAWGWPDEVTFNAAADAFDAMGDREFFSVILTLSCHLPYRVPDHGPDYLSVDEQADSEQQLEINRLNSYRYADWAIGQFFRRARKAPWFKNTIFVLVADHGHILDPLLAVDVPRCRVPCVFYAPGIIPAETISTICSQTDISPTLLAMLGGTYEHGFMGRNIRGIRPGDGFAPIFKDTPAFLSGELALVLPPPPSNPDHPIPILFRTGKYRMVPFPAMATDPDKVRPLKQRMLSYYSVARELYEKRLYGIPESPPNRTPATGTTRPTMDNAND